MSTKIDMGDESLANFFAELGDVIFQLDAGGIIVRCFGPPQRLGAPARTLIGQRLQTVLPIEASYPIVEAITRVQTGGKVQTLEFLWTTEPLRHFEARIAPSHDGGVIAVLRDIHEHKNAQMELVCNRGQLQESEIRFRSMADHAPVLLWMTGTDASCTFFNQRWMHFTGRPLEQEIGVGWAEGVHAEDFQHCMHIFLDAFVTRREFAMEYRLRNAAGEYRWIYDQGTPRFAPEGDFLGFIGSCIDVTDIHEARERLRHMNQELEERVSERTHALLTAVKELEAFSYSVSHDLRGPLRIINGFSHMLADEHAANLNADAQLMLQRIRDSAQRMGTLIDDLLQLSRVSLTEPVRSKVNISSLARDVVEELKLREGRREVMVSIEKNLFTHADGRLLRIVLDNLLGNAWKFTSRRDLPRITLGAERLNGSTVYFVRDNGAGFDMNYAGKLFMPFQRLHTNGDFSGTGVGLATTRRIVERHGGRIWAESEIGQGATFYFTLESNGLDFKKDDNSSHRSAHHALAAL